MRDAQRAAEAAEARGGRGGGGGGRARAGAGLEPGAAAAYNLWASLEARYGEMERAMAVLKEALERHPRDAALHQSLGTLLERQARVT